MLFLKDPFFWALIGMFGLLGAAAISSGKRTRIGSLVGFITMLLFALGQLMLVLPWCPQPRFDVGDLYSTIGCIILVGAAVLGILALRTSPLETVDMKVEFKTTGLYAVIRNPIYLAEILLAFGLAILFGSIIGVAMIPAWWTGILFVIMIEEQRLERELGQPYLTYKNRVQGRMIPGLMFGRKKHKLAYPFRNMVFKGGGAKGIAYIGVLETLAHPDYDILKQIERVGGTSAGAMVATMLSMRLSIDEIIALMNSLLDVEEDEGIVADVENLQRFIRKYGWHSSDDIYSELQELIADRCQGNGMATFSDFRANDFLDLYVVANNISTHSAVIFSATTTPNVAVADAVRMSISVPFLFEGLKFDGSSFGSGDYYVDGGLLDNYPIHIFDDPAFEKGNPWFIGGANWQTLGCYLYTPQDCSDQHKPIKGMIQYIKSLFETVFHAQDAAIENSISYLRRSIMISNCCIDSLDSSIKPNDEKYDDLVQSGKMATQTYLENYKPPIMNP